MVKIVKLHNQSEQLVAQLKNQNRKAQYKFYKLHSPKLLGIIRMYISDINSAEEVLSNCFVKIFKKIDSFNGPTIAIHNWIRTIAIREAIDFLRTKNNIEFLTDQFYDFGNEGNNSVDNDHEINHLQDKIDQLPEGYKMVFMLYVMEDYSHESIAQELNISQGTSKSQLFKAKKMLRRLLTEEDYKDGKI
jgi:RNA polymerase sigma-70 factor (ECF subfamily)